MIEFTELSLWKSFIHDDTKTFADNVCNTKDKDLIGYPYGIVYDEDLDPYLNDDEYFTVQ